MLDLGRTWPDRQSGSWQRIGAGVEGCTGLGTPSGGRQVLVACRRVVSQYQWTQTITTNAPLRRRFAVCGSASTTIEEPFTTWGCQKYGNHFSDHPSRVPDVARALDWDAVLSITSVHVGKRVTILESLKYGFTVNSDGTVTARAPVDASSGDVNGHIGVLSGEFGDWTFSTGWL
jgi:hypothetical protein